MGRSRIPTIWGLASSLLSISLAASTPIASQCATLHNATNVACVHNYAAVLPLPFSRPASVDGAVNPLDRFANTSVPDESFGLIRNSAFLVFDEERGLEILGPSPTLETVFEVDAGFHDAPVYVPELNGIIASASSPGVLSQIYIDLSMTPPTLQPFTPTPPIYGVQGGRYFNGTVYWAVAGGNVTINGTSIVQGPGIYALDPVSRTVEPILNNYYGQLFNGPDDLTIASNGDIFFTDPWYGFALNLTQAPPVLHQQTYRFRPSTGAASVVEASIGVPNGIALSPDEATLYITDTTATVFDFSEDVLEVVPRYSWDGAEAKAVYAFDTVESPAGYYLINKRPIWYPEELAPDGYHVAGNGFLVGSSGLGVDVLSPWGELLVRIQTDFVVNNVQFVGRELDELWLFGIGKIARVRWALTGLDGARS